MENIVNLVDFKSQHVLRRPFPPLPDAAFAYVSTTRYWLLRDWLRLKLLLEPGSTALERCAAELHHYSQPVDADGDGYYVPFHVLDQADELGDGPLAMLLLVERKFTDIIPQPTECD